MNRARDSQPRQSAIVSVRNEGDGQVKTIRWTTIFPLLLAGSAVAAQEPAPPPQTGPVTRQSAVRENPLLDFEYSWPEAVSPETRLVDQLKADLSKSYDEALQEARENKAMTDAAGAPFNQNMFHRAWNLQGQTERLTSLISSTDTFTGGAHPNHNSSALLWDRKAGAEVKLTDLFSEATALEAAIRPQFCKLLDAERTKRRQGEVLEGEFGECPAFSGLTIAPAGKKGSGAFDSVVLIADPYVAGPYVEGSYEVVVPVTAALVAALKDQFKSDFKAQRAQ